MTAPPVVRDEEVVGSNPATPTEGTPGQGPDSRKRIGPLTRLWMPLGSRLGADPKSGSQGAADEAAARCSDGTPTETLHVIEHLARA